MKLDVCQKLAGEMVHWSMEQKVEGEISEHIKLCATSWSFNVREWAVQAVPRDKW